MCRDCGCSLTPAGARHIPAPRDAQTVLRDLLADNAAQVWCFCVFFVGLCVSVINLMSTPGAGKTALQEATADALHGELRIAVIEGDLATDNDARRMRAKGIPAEQITTGHACHLDAAMVHTALQRMDLSHVDLLFIENDGTLVCPAAFDLGQHRDVVLLSTPAGDDKPAKYPVMFRAADLVVSSKADLLPVLDDFDPACAERGVRDLANPAPSFTLSARRGTGMLVWCVWLRSSCLLRRLRAALLG